VKYVGTQNVTDALTKSLPRPAFEEHKEYMADTISFQAETERMVMCYLGHCQVLRRHVRKIKKELALLHNVKLWFPLESVDLF